MNSVKSAASAFSGRRVENEVTQTVRIDGEVFKYAVGNDPSHLGRGEEEDLDLVAGVNESDLMDKSSGVGRELERIDTQGTADYHSEVNMGAKSGIQARRVDRGGGSVHISQAIDDAEQELSRDLVANWESDPDFSSIVAEYVHSQFGFPAEDVVTAIHNRHRNK